MTLTMDTATLLVNIKNYKEYTRMIEELEAMKAAIADEIKAAMTEAGESKLIVDQYKITYADCTKNDLDKTALKTANPALYETFMKSTSYKRFTIN